MEQSQHSQVAPEVLAQQKAYKIAKDNFKQAIKNLVQEQKDVKKLRKPGESGERSYISTAQMKHHLNRVELRHMYLAYTLIRITFGGANRKIPFNISGGKLVKPSLSSILNGSHTIEGIKPEYLTTIYNQYAPETVHINS